MQSISRQLNTVGQSLLHIFDDGVGGFSISSPDVPRNDQLGIGVNSGPRPHIASLRVALKDAWVVLNGAFLGVAERPNFIALNALRREVADGGVMVQLARFAKVA